MPRHYTAATDDPDISRYWMIRHYPRVLRWQQHGGGASRILIVDGKHPMEYNISDDGNSIFIRGGHKPLLSPCFVLEIDMSDSTTAILQEVERRGITGMKERATLLGAKFQIQNRLGGEPGCRVTLSLVKNIQGER